MENCEGLIDRFDNVTILQLNTGNWWLGFRESIRKQIASASHRNDEQKTVCHSNSQVRHCELGA